MANDGVWGGSSELMALNAELVGGYTVNIFDINNDVVYGSEHNQPGDTILLLRFGSAHYTALERSDN